MCLNGVDFKFRSDLFPVFGFLEAEFTVFYFYSKCVDSGARAFIAYLMSFVSVPIRELSVSPHSQIADWLLGFNCLRKIEILTLSGQYSSKRMLKEMWERMETKSLKRVSLMDPPTLRDHSEDVKFMEFRNVDELYVDEEGWITPEEFLTLNCKTIQLNFPILSNWEMNQFLKRWKYGSDMRFEWVEWAGRPRANKSDIGEVLNDIDVKRWDKEKRNNGYK